MLGSGRSNKNDPNDAMSVAVTAMRSRDLRRVQSVGNSEVLRLLSKRNADIGRQRSRVVSRLHALIVELAPGGIAREINVSAAQAFLETITPASPVEQIRYGLACELIDDICRLDVQLKESHERIGNVGDVRRFRNRDHFAAYTGTAPVEYSSGGRIVHRLSRRGNRTLNSAIHMAAVTQLRNRGCQGRIYFERKVAEGRPRKKHCGH